MLDLRLGAVAMAVVLGVAPPCLRAADQPEQAMGNAETTFAATYSPIGEDLGDVHVRVAGAAKRVTAEFDIGNGQTKRVPLVNTVGDAWSMRVRLREAMKPSTAESGKPGAAVVRMAIVAVDAEGREIRRGPMEFRANPLPEFDTPEWSKGVTWYQIFPERFRNGNPANDPRPPETFNPGWTSDWSKVTPEELDAARLRGSGKTFEHRASGAQLSGAFRDVVFDRRYGGDLQGVVEKLDELKALGVEAIYLNPIFVAESLHKYDATDFRHVDPTFGGAGESTTFKIPRGETLDPKTWVWTESDRYFVDVVLVEAHRRGMKVVLDGVWNHVGRKFWAFADVERCGKDSAYAGWFDVTFADETLVPNWREEQLDLAPGRLLTWKGWNQVNGGLPRFARTTNGRLAAPVEQHIFDVTRRWMDPNGDGDPADGIDGWRLDVAADIQIPFWTAWRKQVKSINPNAVLIGELWFDARDYLGTVAFDGQMNYPFADVVVQFVAGVPRMGAKKTAEALGRVFTHAPAFELSHMTLLGSHDTERLVSRIKRLKNNPEDSPEPSRKHTRQHKRPSAEVYERSLLGLAMQVLCPGSPMVFAGDEFGVFGGHDPDCRRPMPWPDVGSFADPDQRPMLELREAYRAVLGLRKSDDVGPVLRLGSCEVTSGADDDVLWITRRLNGRWVLAVVNRGASEKDVAASLPDRARRVDVGPAFAGAGGVVGPRSIGLWMGEENTETTGHSR